MSLDLQKTESWKWGLSNEVYDFSVSYILFEKIAKNRRNLPQKIATGRIFFCGSVKENWLIEFTGVNIYVTGNQNLSLHIFKFLMVRCQNLFIRWTVWAQILVRCPHGQTDGWTVRRRPSSSEEAWFHTNKLFFTHEQRTIRFWTGQSMFGTSKVRHQVPWWNQVPIWNFGTM